MSRATCLTGLCYFSTQHMLGCVVLVGNLVRLLHLETVVKVGSKTVACSSHFLHLSLALCPLKCGSLDCAKTSGGLCAVWIALSLSVKHAFYTLTDWFQTNVYDSISRLDTLEGLLALAVKQELVLVPFLCLPKQFCLKDLFL